MGRGSARSRVAAALLPAVLAAVGGCGKDLWVLRHPEFYDPQLKTVAVVPFRNVSVRPGEGEVFAETLIAALRDNGTYQVLDVREIDALLKARGLPAFDGNVPALTGRLGKTGKVQAILAGTVLRHSAYGWDYFGSVGYWPYARHRFRSDLGFYYYSRREAMVSVTARLIRVPDGKTLYATPKPIRAWAWGGHDWPYESLAEGLARAVDEVVDELVGRVAVVRRRVKASPHKDLRTAAGRDGEKWRFTDDFKAGDEEMYVVLSLPPAADRNRFRLTIVRKGTETVLAEQEIAWSRKDRRRGIRFSPRDLAAGGGGPGHYRVRFHSGDDVVMHRDFEIER